MSARVFFATDDADDNLSLWTSNGTVAGTVEVADFNPQGIEALPGGVLLDSDDLWFSNGAPSGTIDLGLPGGLQAVSIGKDVVLWEDFTTFEITNGTAAGTVQLPHPQILYSPDFTAYGSSFVFEAGDAGGYNGLWISNGTPSGTEEIGGLKNNGIAHSAAAGMNPTSFTVDAKKVFFLADDSSGDGYQHLWETNGTASGTTELGELRNKGIGISTKTSDPIDDIAGTSNGWLIFGGVDRRGQESTWATLGAKAKTHELGQAGTGAPGSANFFSPYYADDLVKLGHRAVFAAIGQNGNSGLWVTDGTSAGTVEIDGARGLNPFDLVSLGNKVVFEAFDSQGHETLWVTNGSKQGTKEIGGIANRAVEGGQADGIFTEDLVASGSLAFFHADSSTFQGELWVTNGTVAGTHALMATSNDDEVISSPKS